MVKPPSPAGLARRIAAGLEGFRRYYAAMLEAKELGLIDRMPWGRRPGPQPGKGARPYRDDKIIVAAKAIVMAEKESLPAPVEKPFEQQTAGEKLLTNTHLSLDETHRILTMSTLRSYVDPQGVEHWEEDKKLLSIKKDVALSTIAAQIRVDEGAMRKRSADRLPEILRRIEAINASTAGLDNSEPKLIDFEE